MSSSGSGGGGRRGAGNVVGAGARAVGWGRVGMVAVVGRWRVCAKLVTASIAALTTLQALEMVICRQITQAVAAQRMQRAVRL